jgi:membrane protease YdiL (CAAX protease family)
LTQIVKVLAPTGRFCRRPPKLLTSANPVPAPTKTLLTRYAIFPKKFALALFGLILSGLMSLLVSGISTYRAVGFSESYVGLWVSAWLTAWPVAFPVTLVAAPLARRTVALLVDTSR